MLAADISELRMSSKPSRNLWEQSQDLSADTTRLEEAIHFWRIACTIPMEVFVAWIRRLIHC